MNLSYAHELIAAADQQRHGSLKLCDTGGDQGVEFKAEAGLVEATLSEGNDGSFTSIDGVTSWGQQFIHMFEEAPVPTALLSPETRYAAERQSAQAAVLEKWSVKFALELRLPSQGD